MKSHLYLALSILLLSVLACSLPGQATPAPTDLSLSSTPVPAGSGGARDQNACHLLSHEEVSALVEEKIVMSDQTEAGETWSTCEWEDENGIPLFFITVYWTNGRQEWETWRVAQGLGNEALEQAEGVGPDDLVKQGPVAGIGDAAYFSELLPSLVLKDDILIEMNLFYVPQAETKFADLAGLLLGRIK